MTGIYLTCSNMPQKFSTSKIRQKVLKLAKRPYDWTRTKNMKQHPIVMLHDFKYNHLTLKETKAENFEQLTLDVLCLAVYLGAVDVTPGVEEKPKKLQVYDPSPWPNASISWASDGTDALCEMYTGSNFRSSSNIIEISLSGYLHLRL